MTTYTSSLIFITLDVLTGCNTSHSNTDIKVETPKDTELDMTEQKNNPNDEPAEQIPEEIEQDNRTNNICAFEVPAHFISIEELEVGLGPEGIILGYWSIDFYEDGMYEWNYSDITEFGEFTCNQNIISYSSYEGMHQSVYDMQSEILHWTDVSYQQE